MNDFTPTITSDLYLIHFIPVAIQLNGKRRLIKSCDINVSLHNIIYSLAIVEDYFVVELTLLESPCRQVYTISEPDCNGELYDRYNIMFVYVHTLKSCM